LHRNGLYDLRSVGSTLAKEEKPVMKKTISKTYPLGKRIDPSLGTWKLLLKTARLFHEERPWELFENSDLLAVIDPVSGQTGYCCVMGNGGLEYGIVVYIGDDGLRTFDRLFLGEIDPHEMIHELRGIGLTFGTKEYLEARDLSPIKKLMLAFRGEGWPVFRSYNPGYFPWHITGEDARFLNCCMEQVLVVTKEKAENEDMLINEGPEGKILSRVPEFSDGAIQWKSEYRTQEISEEVIPVYQADEFTVAALARKPVAQKIYWEADSIPMMNPIMDTDPPRLPRVFACVESTAGLALGHELTTPGQDYLKASGEKLAELLRSPEQKPAQIHFRIPKLMKCLAPFLDSIGVEPMLKKKLAILAEFEESMNMHLTKGK
jgi:hypothetical protein